MPLQENGLVTSYRVGRRRYDGLERLLPEKLEQLRRAAAGQQGNFQTRHRRPGRLGPLVPLDAGYMRIAEGWDDNAAAGLT